jgi:hypothetical protein
MEHALSAKSATLIRMHQWPEAVEQIAVRYSLNGNKNRLSAENKTSALSSAWAYDLLMQHKKIPDNRATPAT